MRRWLTPYRDKIEVSVDCAMCILVLAHSDARKLAKNFVRGILSRGWAEGPPAGREMALPGKIPAIWPRADPATLLYILQVSNLALWR